MKMSDLKKSARAVLKKNYLILLVVSTLIAVTSDGIGNLLDGKRYNFDSHEIMSYPMYDGEIILTRIHPLIRTFSGIVNGYISIVFSVILIAMELLISFPLQVGGMRIYKDIADGEHYADISSLLFPFRRGGHYRNIFVAGFLKKFYTFLWTILFIVPGIIKGYSYSMVPFILADNPEMKACDAIRLSKEMMLGHKWEMFVLDLSFIGWYLFVFLIGICAFALGFFPYWLIMYLILPYTNASHAQFYLKLLGGYAVCNEEIDTTAQIQQTIVCKPKIALKMDRVYLKSRAKVVLKKHYLILLIISALVAVATSFGYWVYQKQIEFFQTQDTLDPIYDFVDNLFDFDFYYSSNVALAVSLGFFFILTIFWLITLGGVILISYPLLVCSTRIYIDTADGEHSPNIKNAAYTFAGGGIYANIALAGLLTSLYTVLCYLMLIIPGVIKRYEYRMVPYILADNPEMKATDAMRLSKEMMCGYKMELFKLDLSFTGWFLLTLVPDLFTFGLARCFIFPYSNATLAQFYIQLRDGYTEQESQEDVIDAMKTDAVETD